MKFFVKLNASSSWQEGRLLTLSTNCALLGGVLIGTKMASQSAENLPGDENTLLPPARERRDPGYNNMGGGPLSEPALLGPLCKTDGLTRGRSHLLSVPFDPNATPKSTAWLPKHLILWLVFTTRVFLPGNVCTF